MKILQPQLKKQQKKIQNLILINEFIRRKQNALPPKGESKVEKAVKRSQRTRSRLEEFELERDSATQKIQHLVKQSSDLTGPIPPKLIVTCNHILLRSA